MAAKRKTIKAKRKTNWSENINNVGRFIMSVYYVVMVLVFPFYVQDGYRGIGNAKCFFFSHTALIAVGLMLPVSLVMLFLQRKEISLLERYKGLSVTDWFAYGYLIVALLSYLFTAYKDEAVWGADGWRMGLVSQLLFLGIYFFFSRYFRLSEKMLYLALISSGLVFLLGILNRYSIYPIEMYGQQPGFISTLGNINWFCGFWSVFAPLGIVWYWNSQTRLSRTIAGIYTVVAFLCGVTQGSSSAYLVLVVLFLLLFYLSFEDNRKMCCFLEIGLLFALSCQLGRILRYLLVCEMNYENELGKILTDTNITLCIGMIIGALYLFFRFYLIGRKHYAIQTHKKLRKMIMILVFLICAGYVLVLALNTCLPGGILGLSGIQAFVFNETWASSRGATWISGMKAYAGMSPLQKLIGVGPDCFAEYVYAVPELAEYIRMQFGNSRLTNAHNEWITMLVNQGALGLVCYAGIFLSAIRRFLKEAKAQPMLFLCAASALSYMAHNMVSFQQVLNAPCVFMMLGIGEGILRGRDM
ncbi:MAG: O-antigen ligase family protein [Muribaculaceae bacterium]|nr:O-antigen ligase family protein [Muribaculaceae bacterium]